MNGGINIAACIPILTSVADMMYVESYIACWPLCGSCAPASSHPLQVRMNGGTNIAAALSHAGKVLKRDAGADVAKVIVLITDGRVDGYQVWECQRAWKVWEVWRCRAHVLAWPQSSYSSLRPESVPKIFRCG